MYDHIQSQKVVSNLREQLMFEGKQLNRCSKGCSFYESLSLSTKGASDISFIFTLSRGSIAGIIPVIAGIPDSLAGVDSKVVMSTE